MADHVEDEKRWKQGNIYETYKNFIRWQCRELCKDNEIKVLFDPDNTVSQIFPQERAFKHIFKLINQEKLAQIWKEDEVIGWVYQYFIEDDKDRVFDKIYRQKQKMDLTDIAPATQIFTPRWIVQYLVENTLGRLWIRMHPDTRLIEKMRYYVPNENDNEPIPLKPAKEITLLDPACGTMHFGMVAFDLFYEMYLEEIENTGKDDWPESPSCEKESLIPASIIENNLYGIDIDLRSIQLSALTLYLKAKSKYREISIDKYNLVHTDIPAFSDKAINEFVDSLSSKYELTKKLFKLIMPELAKAYYLGSLLKIEDIINSFLEKQYTILSKQFGKQMHFAFAIKKEQEEILFKKEVVWPEVKKELRYALNEFIEQANEDRDTYVAQESKKGVYLIDAFMRKHDVVVCNPPYSGRRNMNAILKENLTSLYPKKDGDLYTVFIDRCLDLTSKNNGFCGMVTIHSFMFTSSHEQIRKDIIENTSIETLCHLGTRTEFDVANKTAQGFAMYALCKNFMQKDTSKGIYFRLVLENEAEKHLAFKEALNKYIRGDKSDKVYVLEQEKLKTIPGWPFVYWVSDKIRETFQISLLDDIAKTCQGIATADNARFLRLWWEVGIENIYFNCTSHDEAKSSLTKWFPYMKGGKVNRWFGNQEYIINWQYGGKELYDFTPKAVVRNPGYYFLEGATYSFLTVSNLSVRYLPHGFVFDVIGSSIFPKKIDVYCLLGILNSKMASYLIKIISPTIAYQVGDIARIPFPDQTKYPELIERVKKLVKKCIELKKEDTEKDEISWEFVSPPHWETGSIETLEREKQLAIFES
ncbi:MAG: BREX-1 system adenine-specific DNA-methyltransferase PglX, partial [Candidatus Marinimicrobia bacterium]|nr:BREX-1 system adenine-specific DNA-methyltransferase PglX [Candidatus Neomarinimicrobiota bacterium]